MKYTYATFIITHEQIAICLQRASEKILGEQKMKSWCSQGYLFLGELYADTGQREKALEYLKKAQGMFREMGMDYWLGKTQEVLERV